MQSVHASCAGKTFSQARCSDFRDKKPRSRRTKEERKTMVESFIKKYQNLNNGKFPSLNLTHKEVGGSFYTVREIVREVIQQNRVLGPGDSTSKALDLEYCPEELAGESFSMDISAPLSISTINHAVDHRQGESFSLSNVCRSTNQEIIEVDESINQEFLESHLNVTSVTQVLDGEQYHEISNGAYLNGRLENLSYKEPSLCKLSGVTDENSGVYDQTQTEVQGLSSEDPGKVEHTVPSCEAVSMAPPLFESVVNGDDNGDRSNGMTAAINSSSASNSLARSDSLSETNISLDPVPVSAFTCGGEDPPLGSAGDKTCNPGKSQKIVGVTTTLGAPKFSDSDAARVAFMRFEKDSVINGSETTETISSIVVDEVSAASPSRQLSLEKDSVVDGSEMTETLSYIAVDEVSNESLNGSVSQNSDSPALGSKKPLVLPLFQPNDFENVITNIESAGESIRPSFKGKTYSEVKHEHVRSNIGSARKSGSISQNEDSKESETSEINPVWAAIKSLLNAVVKFWTE